MRRSARRPRTDALPSNSAQPNAAPSNSAQPNAAPSDFVQSGATQNTTSDASNPWRSVHREKESERYGLGQGSQCLFVPVAASTPPPRTSLNPDIRTQTGPLFALQEAARLQDYSCPRTHTHGPARGSGSGPASGSSRFHLSDDARLPNYANSGNHTRLTFDNGEPGTPPGLYNGNAAHGAWLPNSVHTSRHGYSALGQGQTTSVTGTQGETTASSEPPMEIDPATDCDETPMQSRPKKDKGKKRATVQDDDSPAAGARLASPEDDDWEAAALSEARYRSLLQAQTDRARFAQTGNTADANGAGPSRRANVGPRSRHDAPGRLSRDDLPSRLFPRIRTGISPCGHDESTFVPTRGCQPGPPRDRSEFLPLPNTRAARYVADFNHARTMRTPPLTQRPALPLDTHARSDSRNRGRSAALSQDPRNETEFLQGDDRQRSARESESEEDDEVDDQMEGVWREEGEIIPSALCSDDLVDEDWPTDIPSGGFPTIHRDDPETSIRGMATDWIREVWRDPANTDILLEVYNYQYSEEDEHNRRISNLLQSNLSLIAGESGFNVVPPEPASSSSRRSRDRPSMWAVRGLSPRGVARALARSAWSFKTISFLTFPRAATLPSWLFMLEGFLNGNTDKIRAAVLRVLGEESMREWIAEMASTNPEFAGWPADEAVDEILDSLRVDTFQLSNGNLVANIYILRSPTRSMKQWRRWVASLRSRRYPSFTSGTGRVRYIAPCAGCKSVNHLTHLCPFPRIRGWNGPPPGEGVFGERRHDEENDPDAAYRRRPAERRSGRGDHNDIRPRGGRRDGWQQGPSGRGRGGTRSSSSARMDPHSRAYYPYAQRDQSSRGRKGPGRGSGGSRKF
ncbi:hypothetical protein C8T65DRAFT_749462 [Cerioporus squamosus]|nr:hypothetical protein C8T65DRAFT_749462 [Cerioporus squamosus]